MDTTKEPAVLSICTGIGGLETGVEWAIGPLRTIAYVEIEAFIVENLLAGMEAGFLAPAPIWANLKSFPWEYFRGKVDILMGGYPCQPFSVAGKQRGKDDPRHLWPYIEAGIRAIRPVCCFFENVPGHLTNGYAEVRESLEKLGYRVEEGIFSAEEVGAPHRRERLFILAILVNADDYARGLYESARWITNAQIVRSGESMADAPHREDLGRERGELEGTERGRGCEHAAAISSGEDVDDTLRDGPQQEYAVPAGRDPTFAASESGVGLADPSGLSKREPTDQTDALPNEGDAWQEPRSASGGVLDDAIDQRLQAYPGTDSGEKGRPQPHGSIAPSSFWPARPGEPQFDWEPPRTIESGVGCVINGYNFREDLLRALGNGVVPQVAYKAFIYLLRKHLK